LARRENSFQGTSKEEALCKRPRRFPVTDARRGVVGSRGQCVGLNPNDATGNNGASGDQDGDGRTNSDEFILGTNPAVADAASAALTIARTSPTTVALTFPSVRDRIYKIYYTISLTSPTWTQAGGNIAGTGSSITYTDDGSGTGGPPTASQPRFYRLDVSLAP
jgi:hypothetical protein